MNKNTHTHTDKKQKIYRLPSKASKNRTYKNKCDENRFECKGMNEGDEANREKDKLREIRKRRKKWEKKGRKSHEAYWKQKRCLIWNFTLSWCCAGLVSLCCENRVPVMIFVERENVYSFSRNVPIRIFAIGLAYQCNQHYGANLVKSSHFHPLSRHSYVAWLKQTVKLSHNNSLFFCRRRASSSFEFRDSL